MAATNTHIPLYFNIVFATTLVPPVNTYELIKWPPLNNREASLKWGPSESGLESWQGGLGCTAQRAAESHSHTEVLQGADGSHSQTEEVLQRAAEGHFHSSTESS